MPKHRQSISKNEAEGEEADLPEADAPLRTEEEREAYRQTLERLSGIFDNSPMLEIYGNDVDAYVEDIRGR